uniref:Uncharacterized protein n=1 Tax=Lepeophtheirus salmonis TaxID=72036 RepID=A0A0K2UYV7_LEPSM
MPSMTRTHLKADAVITKVICILYFTQTVGSMTKTTGLYDFIEGQLRGLQPF